MSEKMLTLEKFEEASERVKTVQRFCFSRWNSLLTSLSLLFFFLAVTKAVVAKETAKSQKSGDQSSVPSKLLS